VRSLSLSPGSGIIENIGEPFEFERAYWAGEHPVEPWLGDDEDDEDDDGLYPLPFNPIQLGEDALRALFGFGVAEPQPGDVDPIAVHLHGFRVTDPTGVEQARRDAEYAEVTEALGQPRVFRLEPHGTLHKVDLDD
jgi:uncharacterized protein DUF6928